MSVLSRVGDAFNWADNLNDPDLPPGEWLIRSQSSYHTTAFWPDVTGKAFLTNRRLIFKRGVPRYKVSLPRVSQWRTLSLNLEDISEMTVLPFGRAQLLELRMQDSSLHRVAVKDASSWIANIEEARRGRGSGRPNLWRSSASLSEQPPFSAERAPNAQPRRGFFRRSGVGVIVSAVVLGPLIVLGLSGAVPWLFVVIVGIRPAVRIFMYPIERSAERNARRLRSS